MDRKRKVLQWDVSNLGQASDSNTDIPYFKDAETIA